MDGYAARNKLLRKDGGNDGPRLAGCWAHSRRRFYELHAAGHSQVDIFSNEGVRLGLFLLAHLGALLSASMFFIPISLQQVADAAEKLEDWRRHYNDDRPHSTIGYNIPSALHFLGGATSPPP